ncbi:unnamed protein product, partial [Didymodactylos carnosus]
MLSYVSSWFKGKVTISEPASLFEGVLNSDAVGIVFFDSVLAHFHTFDEFNQRQNKTFLHDVDYITQCTITDLTSKKHSIRSRKRIDAYLYIYCRIQEYIYLANAYYKPLGELKQVLFQLLVSAFEQTKGQQPNLLVYEKDVLLRMDIPRHLSSIATIDDLNTLKKFFVLSKLSMQATQFMNDSRYRLQWIDILSKVKITTLSLEQFIRAYLDNQEAFTQFPFDTPVLIHLIHRLHPSKQAKESPFKTFFQFNQALKLDPTLFFEQFHTIFSCGIKNRWYEMKDIAELFTWVSRNDQLCGQYVSHYSSNVDTDDLWDMFLHLYKINALNSVNIQKYLIPVLNQRISIVTIGKFQRYAKSAKTCLVEIKPERLHLIDLFGKIFDAYVIKQITDPQYSYQISQTDSKDLLQIDLEISSTNCLERPSYLLLIRKILFDIDSYQKPNAQKLKALFQNLNNFDANLCEKYTAENIIDDEWLKDFLITNISIWLKLDKETYKYLCENHQNNPWAIYIWSKIIHLSLSKMLNNNHIEILSKINEWMKNVKHDIYNPTDIFTTILVNKLCELVLAKYSRTILMLPNIDTIMNFIISMREHTSVKIDVNEINNFISNGKEIIHEILRLNSKCSLYRDLLTDSIIRCFVPLINMNSIFRTADRQQYKFPSTNANIDDIVALPKPKDIDTINIRSNEEFFAQFIQQINKWLDWFDRFIDIFQHIIDWLKIHNVNRSNQLLIDLLRIRDDPKMTLIEMRIIIDSALKILQPFKDLRRLCQLFNCLIPFQILNPGTLNIQENTMKFLTELKRFQPNNRLTVE